MIKIRKRPMEHLKRLANSPSGVLELKKVTQKGDGVVQNLGQIMRVSAVQEKSDVIAPKNEVHGSKN